MRNLEVTVLPPASVRSLRRAAEASGLIGHADVSALTRHTVSPEEIVARRSALHLSQVDLARQLGVAANTVNRWEAGTRGIPTYLWLALEGIEHVRQCKANY